MEEEPIDYMDIEEYENVEQDQNDNHMLLEEEFINDMDIREFDLDEQHQIDDHLQWEENYEAYIYETLEEERLEYISNLISNYRGGGNYNKWNNWNDVDGEYKKDVIKIMYYEIIRNISPPIEELQDYNAYYNYLLFLANTLRNL